jgi:hypothetical protein
MEYLGILGGKRPRMFCSMLIHITYQWLEVLMEILIMNKNEGKTSVSNGDCSSKGIKVGWG